jgi:hypothetical protein
MTRKEEAENIEKAVREFNKLMLKKKGVTSYANWSLRPDEVEPELNNVSKRYNVSKRLIGDITEIR